MKKILKVATALAVVLITSTSYITANAAYIDIEPVGSTLKDSNKSISSALKRATTIEVDENTLPSSYNSRDLGFTTPIRNQQNTNSCWAFGSLSSLETLFCKNGIFTNTAESWLSPAHMDAWGTTRSDGTGWLRTYEYGSGYPYISMGYLTSWSGAVNEYKYPFHTDYSSFNFAKDDSINYGVTGIMYINGKSPETVKKCIMDSGAVTGSYNSAGKFNAGNMTGTFCPSKQDDVVGHTISVVGWDDNYKKEDLSVSYYVNLTAEEIEQGIEQHLETFTPKNDGAWLCKNSWGPYNTLGGYFWISYEDYYLFSDTFGPSFCYTDYKEKAVYDNLYQVEKYGATYDFGYLSQFSKNNVYINVFDIKKSNEYLNNIFFETTSVGAEYSLYYIPVESDGVPSTDTAKWRKLYKGTVPYTGYISTDIDDYLLPKGKVGIGVRIDTTNCDDPTVENNVGVDEWLNAGDSRVFNTDAKEGVSYIYYNNIMDDVMDYYSEMLGDNEGGNLVIKAFTKRKGTLKGDANNDGVLDIKDAVVMQKCGIRIYETDDVGEVNADYNVDGKINVRDCTLFQRDIAEESVTE